MIKFLENPNELDNAISETNHLAVVVFFATWCGPCKMYAKELEAYSSANPTVEILRIDVDKFPNLASKFNVRSIPHTLIFEHGQIHEQFNGFINRQEFDEKIKHHLSHHHH